MSGQQNSRRDARHMRTTISLDCGGCDGWVTTYCDTSVIVKSPGSIALVVTCPDCSTPNVSCRLDEIAVARSGGTPCVVLRPADLRHGAQRDGAISEGEVATFRDRLGCTPDGGPGRATHPLGLLVVLGGLWSELGGAAGLPGFGGTGVTS